MFFPVTSLDRPCIFDPLHRWILIRSYLSIREIPAKPPVLPPTMPFRAVIQDGSLISVSSKYAVGEIKREIYQLDTAQSHMQFSTLVQWSLSRCGLFGLLSEWQVFNNRGNRAPLNMLEYVEYVVYPRYILARSDTMTNSLAIFPCHNQACYETR